MKRLTVMLLATAVTVVTGLQASDKYRPGKEFADSLKGSGTGVLENFNPEASIPGYNPNPPETGHYGGVAAGGAGSLESAGAGELLTSDVGQLTSEVIMNRPDDPISMDAPFISNGFEIQDKADLITSGSYDQCETVNVSKTELTTHLCERTPATELSCTRKANIGGQWQPSQVVETIRVPTTQFRYVWDGDTGVDFWFTSPESGTVQNGLLTFSVDDNVNHFDIRFWGLAQKLTGKYHQLALPGAAGAWLAEGQSSPAGKLISQSCLSGNQQRCREYARKTADWLTGGQKAWMEVTLVMTVTRQEWAPRVEWVEACPFDKSVEVQQGSQCTEPGGNRVVSMGGKEHTVYSDCWAWKDSYLSQEADNGSCDVYMKNPACTVLKTDCLERIGSTCVEEAATFSCEKKISGEAQLCSGQLVCASGECDALENNKTDSFAKAVSALAAVSAAAQDVSELNDINVRAFTGQKQVCRMAIAGFSNCCKNSGWGQDIGLAQCDTEEKALAKAKEKLLTVYVGTYCSRKVLGVCLQKKKTYCQFESKLAQIVQAQGRKPQLGIGFGSGENPDCRGITVEELQLLKFDQMDFSNFYSDLDVGSTIPSDSALADRVKQQIEAALQQAAGKD